MDLVELKLTGGKINRHPWELARLDVVKDLMRKVQQVYQPPRHPKHGFQIMDVGCGDAYVVSQLAAFFAQDQFFGYDKYMTEEEFEVLNGLYGQVPNLRIGASYEALSQGVEQVSMILLLDVIEHIDDIIGFLRSLKSHANITPKTHLLITVPAYQSLFTDHDVFLEHFRRYDKAMMRQQMAATGYEILEQGHFFTSLVLPRWLQKITQTPKPKEAIRQGGIAQWKGSRAFTQFVRRVLYYDYRANKILRQFEAELPGLSLYCVCRPKP